MAVLLDRGSVLGLLPLQATSTLVFIDVVVFDIVEYVIIYELLLNGSIF